MAKPKWKQVNYCNGRPIVYNEPVTGRIETPANTLFACWQINLPMALQKGLSLAFFYMKKVM